MHLFASVHASLFLHVCWRMCMCVLQDAKETKGPKWVFCSWITRLRAEGEEEGASPPREGSKWSEGGRGSLRGEGARGDLPCCRGCRGRRGRRGLGVRRVQAQGWGGGGALSPQPFSPPPAARPHLRRLVPGSPGGNGGSPPPRRPPHSSPPPRGGGPSLVVGAGGRGTLHSASSQVTWAAGSGRWRLAAVSTLVPGGLRLVAPTLPPSQAPTLGRGGGSRGSGNLRGAVCEQGPLITLS